MGWTYHNKPPMGWPLDLDETINDGLAIYGLFNEGSGNKVFDLSGNGNTGTFNGNTAWSIGKFGSAINNPGAVGDFISIPDIGENVSTLSAFIWVKTTDTDNKGIFAHWTDAQTQRSWVIVVANDAWGGNGDELGILLSDDGSFDVDHRKLYVGLDAGDEIADGKWHFVGFTWNAGTLKLYVDGREITTTKVADAAITTIHNSTIELSIGATNPDSGGTTTINSILDIPMVYNRTLTDAEIALLYRFPFYGFMDPDKIPVLDQYYTVAAGGVPIFRRRRAG